MTAELSIPIEFSVGDRVLFVEEHPATITEIIITSNKLDVFLTRYVIQLDDGRGLVGSVLALMLSEIEGVDGIMLSKIGGAS